MTASRSPAREAARNVSTSRRWRANSAGPTELFAAAYAIAYLAFSLPALAAGFAATRVGLPTTVDLYAAVVILIGVVAFKAVNNVATVASTAPNTQPVRSADRPAARK